MLHVVNKRYFNNTAHCSLLLLTILSIAILSFVGVIIWKLFNPVTWVTPHGLSIHPLPMASMSSCSSCQFWFLCWFWFFVICYGGYEATPPWVARVPLGVDGSIPHQGGKQALSILTWGVLNHFTHPSLFCLANHDPVQWVVTSVLGFTIHWHQWALTLLPLSHVCVPSKVHGHITLPKVFTLPWWMLWWMSMAEVITSH